MPHRFLPGKTETLAALEGLHRLSRQLTVASSPDELCENLLSISLLVMDAQFGNVQLLDAEGHALRIVAQKGFGARFLGRFREVTVGDDCACGRALCNGTRIVIPDVRRDPGFAPFIDEARAAGYQAVQSTPLVDRAGRVFGVLSTHWTEPHDPNPSELAVLDMLVLQAGDLLERMRAHEKLHEAERLFRQMAQTLPHALWLTDARGESRFHNHAWSEYVGSPSPPGDWLSCVHVDDRERVREAWSRALAEPGLHTCDIEARLRSAAGEYRWFQIRGNAITDQAGGVQGCVGTATDIHKRKLAELAKERFLRSIDR